MICAAAAVLALTGMGGGCGGVSEYNPVDSSEIRGRDVLVLPSTRVPPLPEKLLGQLQDRFEAYLESSPYLGRVVTRGAFLETAPPGSAARKDLYLMGETLSVLSMTDRETSAPFAETHGVQLLAQVQLIQVPCELCERGSLLGLIANLVEPAEGKLIWRVHFTWEIEHDPPFEVLEAAADAMAEELGDMLTHLLSPKWHRSRFDNLRKHSS